MHLIANDVAQSGVFAAEPIVDGGKLSVVVADDMDNLVVFHPGEADGGAARGAGLGMMRPAKVRMRCVADFHLGAAVSQFVGVPLVPPPPPPPPPPQQLQQQQQGMGDASQQDAAAKREGAFFGGVDGSAGAMVPVDEQVFRRLYSLQVRTD